MKICTFGNCQTNILAWYIKNLVPQHCVKWIQTIDKFKDLPLERGSNVVDLQTRWWYYYRDGIVDNSKLMNPIDGLLPNSRSSFKYIQECDIVIHQNISPKKSKLFNRDIIHRCFSRNSKVISVSSLYYHPDHHHRTMTGMEHRDKTFNVTIPAHKLISQVKDIKIVQDNTGHEQYQHPNAVYFLEVVRQICNLTGLDYYSDEQFKYLLALDFPFAKYHRSGSKILPSMLVGYMTH